MVEESAPTDDAVLGEAEALPELSLDIFDLIKTAQGLHGLRHGDYGRYRQYCSRRLHRLRKTAALTHGKGRYAKRPIEPESVRDARALMLPLFCAERAWAYAMQLKRDNTAQEPRPHYHLLARLAKAVAWSEKLASLCAERTDQRTELEAKAYAAFMSGNLSLERELWAPALASFNSCVTICKELSRVSLAEQVHLYSQMVAEVEPSIRFCTYNLNRNGGDGAPAAEMDGKDVEGLAVAEGASDILRSKLEQVLAATRARQAENLTELLVLGERVPIKSDKTRLCIVRGQQLLNEVEGTVRSTKEEATVIDSAGGESDAVEDQMTKYDKLFVAFNDALDSVRQFWEGALMARHKHQTTIYEGGTGAAAWLSLAEGGRATIPIR